MIAGIQVLVGIALLALGRQLFWLFVGGIGFVFGATLITSFFESASTGLTLIVALAAGLLGALLALFMQKLAIGLAGFIGGGFVALSLLEMAGLAIQLEAIPFLIGGILGAVLVAMLFDWALIVLSSLVGAGFVVQSLDVGRPVALLLLAGLCLFGLSVQANQLRRKQGRSS